MKIDADTSGDATPETVAVASNPALMRFTLIGLLILALVHALYIARDFFMPVLLAFLLALTLSPIVRALRKHGVPSAVSATLLVMLCGASIFTTGYLLSGPVVRLTTDAPSIGRKVTQKLSEFRRPFDHLLNITQQVEQIADAAQEPGVQKVVVSQPGIVFRAAGSAVSAATSIAIIFLLSLFLLASGTLFYEKIIQSFALLSEKKRALRLVFDIEREISRYLLTIALINGGLGIAVGLGLWAIGVPDPFVWGVAAALLNFLPYVGAAINVAAVAAISLVSFDSVGYALLAPAFVVLCNTVEGQLVTPLVVGRRLEINAVAIFIAVAFWSWLWGFVGALIAVPMLVVIKVFCDHFDNLRHVGNFLSAQQTTGTDEDERQTAA